MPDLKALTTGERIEVLRRERGMSRAVLAGLVGRSPDWLKKVERGQRQITKLPMLLAVADALGIADLSVLTGDDKPVDSSAWDGEIHHTVPAIRDAIRQVGFAALIPSGHPLLTPEDLQQRVSRLWRVWHSTPRQRTVVGTELPTLIHQAHGAIQAHQGFKRRQAQAAAGDLYRLVQRLLAHISEPELHAVAVERGRAMSESADTRLSVTLAAWSSSVSLSASGYFDEAAHLADVGVRTLAPVLAKPTPEVLGVLGALQLEAAAAHGFAGRAGDAFRYLDQAALTARMMPPGASHLQSGFDGTNVEIIGVIVSGGLRRTGEAIVHARRLDPTTIPSVVRRSRFLLEIAQTHALRNDPKVAIEYLRAAADVSDEAVALIPWVRQLADQLVADAPAHVRRSATQLADQLKAVR
ncbi:helix-turn-helix domain-containing protein [Kribbella pittospori]|uniref:helix-turn-helix domain-containing protein n=1 Tax=Kribbella pittospori TaxID=722689 RepID=UPI0013F419A2|nr:helix-turn-helix transcriptional regulator [Kribbella pittospori]